MRKRRESSRKTTNSYSCTAVFAGNAHHKEEDISLIKIIRRHFTANYLFSVKMDANLGNLESID